MDIWHIIPTTNPGGVEVNARSLIKDFPIKAKHTIFSMSNVDGLMLEDFKLLADIRILFNQKNIKSIPKTIRLFKKNKPDTIIIHTLNTSLLLFISLARIFKVAKIIILVGNPPFRELLFKLRIFLFFLKILKVPLVFCSNYVLNEFKKISNLPYKSTSIRHGYDIFKADFARKRFKDKLTKNRKLKITMVARLDHIKDHETLIRAFLLINNDQWELQLVGGGEKEDELKKLVKRLDGNKSVKFFGFRNDVLKILSNTEIFAFSTTDKEGFGIALIEALSIGIPIIASDVPACREVLFDGQGGILVQPGNTEIWQKELSLLMDSKDKRYLFANKARKISKYYDIKLVSKEFLKLFNAI